MAGIAELLPAAAGDGDGPVSGTVFKIERGPTGEKVAYVRMFSGTVRTRDRLRFGEDHEREGDGDQRLRRRRDRTRARRSSAGEIGKLWGLAEIQIGDAIGDAANARAEHQFAPPTLETVVVPADPRRQGRDFASRSRSSPSRTR